MAINNTVPKSSNPFADLFSGLQAPSALRLPSTGSNSSVSPFNLGKTQTSTPASSALMSRIGATSTPVAKAATTPVKKATTATTAPVAGASIAGYYQNQPIYGGQDIAAQMAKIDGAAKGGSTGGAVGGLLTPPTPPGGGTSGLMSGAPTTPKPSYSGLVSTILDRTSKSNKEVEDAYKAQQKANADLTKFRESVADTTRDIYSTPTSARVMQGRDQALQVANAGKESALGSQLESATGLYNASLTGQGQQLSALTSALGSVAPTVGQFGQTFYDPLNPGASGDSSGIVSGWASFLSGGGDPSQVPAAVSGNPVLWQQTLSAAKQQNPNFDVNTALGSAAGRQSNASTAGSAIINTAAQGYQTTTQNYNQMTAVNNAAHTQATNLKNILEQTGINANDPTLFNKALNKVSKFTSSPQYASFATALTELQNMYSQLLQTGGGTPTGNEQQALNVLNPNSSAAAIGAAIGQLEQAAYAKLQAQYQQANGYLQQLQQGGGGASGGGNAAGGSLFSW